MTEINNKSGYKYIYVQNNHYKISKRVNGEIKSCYCKTLEEAIKKRNELEKNGWQFKSKTPKYYYKRGENEYIVSKKSNGKVRYFAKCATEEEAQEKVEYFKKHGWDPKYTHKRKHCKHNLPKYIRKNGKKYLIVKWLHGKLNYFGVYYNLKDAVNERDLLIKYNWDINTLIECE